MYVNKENYIMSTQQIEKKMKSGRNIKKKYVLYTVLVVFLFCTIGAIYFSYISQNNQKIVMVKTPQLSPEIKTKKALLSEKFEMMENEMPQPNDKSTKKAEFIKETANNHVDSNSKLDLEDKKYLEELIERVQEFHKYTIDSLWIYQNELKGILSLKSTEEIKEMQLQKLKCLPQKNAIDCLVCEGIWYTSAYGDIKNSKFPISQEKLDKMLMAAHATFESVLEIEPNNLMALQGMAAYYSETNQNEKAIDYLKKAITATEKDNIYDSIKNHVALVRLLRQINPDDVDAVNSAYNNLLSFQLLDKTRNQIIKEKSNTNIPNFKGIGIFDVQGLSFNFTKESGVVSRIKLEERENLLASIASDDEVNYNPKWIQTTSILQDGKDFITHLTDTSGFLHDPYSRLYHSNMLLKIDPDSPLALAGLAQSLQETNQPRKAMEYFNEALEIMKGIEDTDAEKSLTNYIYFRMGFSAITMQKPEEAVKYWELAKDVGFNAEISNICEQLIQKYQVHK